MRQFWLALIVLLLMAALVSAQCRRRISYANEVAVVATPVVTVQPILIPSYVFQFLPAFYPGYAQSSYVQQQGQVQQGTPMEQQGTAPQAMPAAPAPAAQASPEAVIRKYGCVQCHTDPGKKGIVLFSKDGKFAPNVSAKRIWNAADGQGGIVMPPDAGKDTSKAVSDDDLKVLRAWMMTEK